MRVLLGEVTDIDLERRRVSGPGLELDYDILVLATGARHDHFGRDWAPIAPGLKTIADATEIVALTLFSVPSNRQTTTHLHVGLSSTICEPCSRHLSFASSTLRALSAHAT